MIEIQFMKPFYTKVSGVKLRLVFAYQYLTIKKDNEAFQFIPIEGKEMIVDLNTMQVENLSDIFVFQRGNRFIRLPLHQLFLVSNVRDYLTPIIESVRTTNPVAPVIQNAPISEEAETITFELEHQQLLDAIDKALDNGNEVLFMELSSKLQNNLITL